MIKREPIHDRARCFKSAIYKMIEDAEKEHKLCKFFETYTPETGKVVYSYNFTDGQELLGLTRLICTLQGPFVGRKRVNPYMEAMEAFFKAEEGIELLYLAPEESDDRYIITVGRIDGVVTCLHMSESNFLTEVFLVNKAQFTQLLENIARDINYQLGEHLNVTEFASEKMNEFGHLFD